MTKMSVNAFFIKKTPECLFSGILGSFFAWKGEMEMNKIKLVGTSQKLSWGRLFSR